jgi:two-component system NtrC family sensor kinase
MIILIGIDEYLSFEAEVEQYEADMVTNAIQDGNSISGMIGHVWKESGEKKALEFIHDASESGTINIRWVWVDTLFDESQVTNTEKEQLEKLELGESVSMKMRNKDGVLLRYTYVPVDIGKPRKGALELSQALLSLRQYSSKMLTRAFTITALLALISGLILYVFIDRKIRVPLDRLMRQAKRIGDGDLSADLSPLGNDELTEMATTMNDMCSRLIIAKEKIKFEYDARLKTLEQLRHTERLSTFGLISADIAHEIGTPINVVDGRAKMIINENLNAEEIKECANIIKNQAKRMTLIIRQLLDFTRRPRKQISMENISFHVKQVFQLLYPMAAKQHVSFSLNTAEDTTVQLRADGSQIQQVLINLLMNSVQAMPDGGKVCVSLANEMLPASQDADKGLIKHMRIRIVDEGEGISQEDIENIFTPFFTTKTIGTGTGLGLSIAHGIVEEHDGWIDVESSVQSGACFSVYLPMKELKQ